MKGTYNNAKFVLLKEVSQKYGFTLIPSYVKADYEPSSSPVINPRRACAARVTVLRLSVCLSVCYN